jgi:hypothetical protein
LSTFVTDRERLVRASLRSAYVRAAETIERAREARSNAVETRMQIQDRRERPHPPPRAGGR